MPRRFLAAAAVLSAAPYFAANAVAQYPTVYDGGVTASGVSGPQFGRDHLYPYESQEVWLHGYYQEIPAYGGYHAFAPYNYKHLLSQSQTAAGFGMSPVMPYSQQFWHRYENRANLRPYANEPNGVPGAVPPAPVPAGPYSYAPAPQQFAARAEGAAPAILPAQTAGPVIVPANAEEPRPADSGRWTQYRGGKR